MALPISVVIPLFNKAVHITRTVESALSQVPPPDEIIVVDDGSDDGGAKRVAERFASAVKIVAQMNQGVSVARNFGIQLARNEYVCLLDADDEWQPGFLAEITRLIEMYPDAAFYSAAHYFDDAGRRAEPRSLFPTGTVTIISNFPKEYARGFGVVSSSSVCIRKSLFMNGLAFPPGKRRGEDIYYWLRLGMLGSLVFSAKFLVKINRIPHEKRQARSGAMPYHIDWYFSNRHEIDRHTQGKHIRALVKKNALVTAYALAADGERLTAARMMCVFLRHREVPFFILMIPALVLPAFVLRLGAAIRRRIPAFANAAAG